MKTEYTIENGRITDLGKFEGEPEFSPYYWNLGLEGCYDEDENGVYFFVLGDTDYDAFPQLKGEYGIALEESEQGFVTSTTFGTKADYDVALTRMQTAGIEDEEEEEETPMRCDQCEALMINGTFCHETGCPNTHSRYDADSDTWIEQRKCFECGCTVDATDPCCTAEPDEN